MVNMSLVHIGARERQHGTRVPTESAGRATAAPHTPTPRCFLLGAQPSQPGVTRCCAEPNTPPPPPSHEPGQMVLQVSARCEESVLHWETRPLASCCVLGGGGALSCSLQPHWSGAVCHFGHPSTVQLHQSFISPLSIYLSLLFIVQSKLEYCSRVFKKNENINRQIWQ